MIREICFFAVTMFCVGLYVAWRERRVRRSLQRTIEANAGEVNAGEGSPGPKEDLGFGAMMQLAVGPEARRLAPAATQRSLVDQRLLSQVNQLLALRG